MTAPPWLSWWRHLPTPTQRLAACAKEPPSCGKRKKRSCGVAGAQSPPSLRCSSRPAGRARPCPGSSCCPGRRGRFSSWNALTRSSPNMRVSSSPRDWPSPCSPDSEPPCRTTRPAARSMNSPVPADAFGAVEVERDAGVHAALAEVAVKARARLVAVAELVVQLLQVPGGSRRAGPGGRPSLPSLPRCRGGRARARSRQGRPRGPPRARPRGPGSSKNSTSGSCSVSCSASSIPWAARSTSSRLSPPNWTMRNAVPLRKLG